jgi:hypothetical protein
VGVDEGPAVFVAVGVKVDVGVLVGVGEGPIVLVAVGVRVLVGVGVRVGVLVGPPGVCVAVGVFVGTGPAVMMWIASTSLPARPQTLPSKNRAGE